MTRRVGWGSNFTLDALTQSYDPDFPEYKDDFKYELLYSCPSLFTLSLCPLSLLNCDSHCYTVTLTYCTVTLTVIL